jgi:hypothetical protein
MDRPPVRAQRFVDDVLSLEVPAGWSAAASGQDPNVHCLNLTGPAGAFGRVTLIRESATPGTFPGEVLEAIRRQAPDLASQPYEAELARRPAKGFRYTFRRAGADWEGWVVSYVQERSEVCAMGQFPTPTKDVEQELKAALRTLRLKGEAETP